jgi:HEAT repeat protein
MTGRNILFCALPIVLIVAALVYRLVQAGPEHLQVNEIDDCVQRLASLDCFVRREAAEELRRIMSRAELAIDALAIALGDPDPIVRADATSALAKSGPRALPTLMAAFKNGDLDTRRSAAGGLGQLGLAAAAAIPDLIAALDDLDVGWQAGQSLSVIGQTALKPLMEAVRHPSARARANAVEALGDLTCDASAAIPCVENALNDSDERVRTAAAMSLAAIRSHAQLARTPN